MRNDLVSFEKDQMDKFIKAANMLSKSTLVPKALQGKVEDIFSMLLLGSDLGIGPMQSLNSIYVVQGRPTMSAQLMLALVRNRVSDFTIDYEVDSDNKRVTCRAARGKDKADCMWDMERASLMFLTAKDNWKKQPITMLKWRATSEILRFLCSDVLMGLQDRDEMQDAIPVREIKEENDLDKLANALDMDANLIESENTNPEDLIIGSETFLFKDRKFRGKRMGEIENSELLKYYDYLEKKGVKADEIDTLYMETIALYLEKVGYE